MLSSKELVSKVYELTHAELSRTNWKKRKPGIFTLVLNNEALGWLGLNTAHYQDGVAINPVVGVRHQQLEEVIAECIGLKPSQYIPASLSSPVGYLMPENRYITWSFREDSDCETQVVSMVAAIEKFGRPFVEQNRTLATLYSALLSSRRGTPPDQLDYRIAAAADLLGKHTEAETFIDARLREIGNRNDEAAVWFRNFATKLRER